MIEEFIGGKHKNLESGAGNNRFEIGSPFWTDYRSLNLKLEGDSTSLKDLVDLLSGSGDHET